ncbi:MAG: acyl-CoA dehydrogenase family protein [Halobacteria archaeon]
MVDFSLPPELEDLQRRTRAFAAEQMRPLAREYDGKEHAIPHGFLAEARKRRIHRPEPGVGLSSMEAAVFAEELAWGDPGLLRTLPGTGLAGVAITVGATAEQREKFLAPFKGEAWGCMAMTEPGAGSDTSSIRTTARREGDSWVLNGEKVFASNADLALDRGVTVVWAKILPPGARSIDEVEGHMAMAAFVVPARTPGARVTKIEKKMGLKAAHTCVLVLEECRIPAENRLGGDGEEAGFGKAMATFNANRPVIVAAGLGSVRAAVELLHQHLRPRYGLAPGKLSAAERDLMRMEARYRAARLLAWRACWLVDRNRPHALEASMAKALGGTVVSECTQLACELLGPLGVSEKLLAEKWMRDVKVTDIFEGTGQINRLIVARQILGYGRKELK